MNDLWALWDKYFPRRPPHNNRAYVEGRVAYKIQEEAFGTKLVVQTQMARIGEAQSRIKTQRGVEVQVVPGTVLVREFDRREHRVTAQADGSSDESVWGTEDALALSFTRRYHRDWRYVSGWGKWLVWDGQRWRTEDTLAATDLIRSVCRQTAVRADNPKVAAKLASAGTVGGVERLARSDRRHAATTDEWDADPWLLNTPGGVVDLKTGRMRPHERADRMTKITTATPSGDCPTWRQFIDEVTGGDKELQSYLQRMVGYGQLGLGDTNQRNNFVQLPVLAGITQIAAGRERYTAYYAVKNDGTLYSWGYNGNGQLGDGTTNQANIAMPRAGGSLAGKTIVKVFGAYVHAFALDSTGALHAWGVNDYGQLGNGNTANQYTPVQVATNVVEVYAGSYDYPITYLKKADKTLWACGYGGYWGNANGSSGGNWNQVPVGNTVVKAVHGGTASYNYGAALMENGTVYAWGYNGNGGLGLGDATNRSSVELVRIAQRKVVDISSYGWSSEQGLVFLLDDGQVLASGYAGEAQLPEDDSETSYVPYPVIL